MSRHSKRNFNCRPHLFNVFVLQREGRSGNESWQRQCLNPPLRCCLDTVSRGTTGITKRRSPPLLRVLSADCFGDVQRWDTDVLRARLLPTSAQLSAPTLVWCRRSPLKTIQLAQLRAKLREESSTQKNQLLSTGFAGVLRLASTEDITDPKGCSSNMSLTKL